MNVVVYVKPVGYCEFYDPIYGLKCKKRNVFDRFRFKLLCCVNVR